MTVLPLSIARSARSFLRRRILQTSSWNLRVERIGSEASRADGEGRSARFASRIRRSEDTRPAASESGHIRSGR